MWPCYEEKEGGSEVIPITNFLKNKLFHSDIYIILNTICVCEILYVIHIVFSL
jgi:hypothetical protein